MVMCYHCPVVSLVVLVFGEGGEKKVLYVGIRFFFFRGERFNVSFCLTGSENSSFFFFLLLFEKKP